MGDLAEPGAVGADREHVEPDYTSICNAGPSEVLATIALRNGERIRKRNRELNAFDVFLRSRGGDAPTLGPA